MEDMVTIEDWSQVAQDKSALIQAINQTYKLHLEAVRKNYEQSELAARRKRDNGECEEWEYSKAHSRVYRDYQKEIEQITNVRRQELELIGVVYRQAKKHIKARY